MFPICFLNVINDRLIRFSTALTVMPTISEISEYFFLSILLNKNTSLCFSGKLAITLFNLAKNSCSSNKNSGVIFVLSFTK